MAARNSEDAFDAVLVPDADLDVGLAPETGGGVEPLAFGEDSADGIERSLAGFLPELMQIVNYHAVQLAIYKVFSSGILRNFPVRIDEKSV